MEVSSFEPKKRCVLFLYCRKPGLIVACPIDRQRLIELEREAQQLKDQIAAV
jgi:hypothetical protein